MRLANAVALITGADYGIGRAAALLFEREGGIIAAVDLDGESAERTASEITAEGGSASGIRADVSNEVDVRSMVNSMIDRLGVPGVLFNNAGIAGGLL